MNLEFEPIRLEQQTAYRELFAACTEKSSDYSFLNLWSWAETYDLSWAWTGSLVWIKQTNPETRYWAPVGAWEKISWPDCLEPLMTEPVIFTRIPETLLGLWRSCVGEHVFFEEERDNWDYLYDVNELIELKGSRFHKKKNLVNQFRKKYDFQYLDFRESIIEKAMAMQADWCTWRDCESSETLSSENRAINAVLENWEKFQGIMGGALLVEGEMTAYTIAENLPPNALVIHFEKGNPEYKGVYQAINQMFLENAGSTFDIVNREQDLGDEGLRKAKLSYHPVGFLKKYRVRLK